MKKFLSVLLIVSLLIFPIKTFAATDAAPIEISDTPLDIVSEDENISVTAAAEGITSGYIYNIKNVYSGKYLNIHNGVDANGTNAYQWTKDGSAEQNFKIIYSPATDSYTFYAMCSSNGNGRVLNVDLVRGVELLASGQNVNLWHQDAGYTQKMVIIPLGQNQYRIACKFNTDLYLTSCGTGNGSSGGTSSSSTGNIFISGYVGNMTQHWIFEPVGPAPTSVPRGHVESVDSTGVTGWVWNNGSPDSPVEVHIYVTDDYGNQYVYTTIANIYRQDMYNCGFGSGYHGYHCPIDWTARVPRTYTIRAYGIGGGNPELGNSPTTFTVRECYGSVDGFTTNGLYGWVWKPDAPQSAITVHLYVNRMNGEQVGVYVVTANEYRSDVQAAGYGTGNYGFSVGLNYASFPEEQLRVTAYAVDGSNYNNSFWSGIYDNRRPINIIAMKDHNGVKFITTYTDPANTWCENIGCTAINRFTGATNSAVVNRIKESSFCIVDTHGSATTIGCFLDGVEQTDLKTEHINALADGYFNGTRCVLLAACYCGQGGASTPGNMVNTLQRKGVETVIGFEDEIKFKRLSEDETSPNYFVMNTEKRYSLWVRTFMQALGNGSTVQNAVNAALTAVEDEHGTGNTFGLDLVYIAGNANQIVKH
ncbi:MAG: RICIN domain-containing protein [Clostridia bacterium]|nr:RICIN domain-containing protein [Clostridia bacterium]